MAITLAKVSHPNQIETQFEFGPFKAVVKTVTLDNSYLTTGEVVTAAQVNMTVLLGVIDMNGGGGLSVTNGSASLPVIVKRSANQKQVTFQPQGYDGASAGKANLEEKANAFDASLYSGNFLFIGY